MMIFILWKLILSVAFSGYRNCIAQGNVSELTQMELPTTQAVLQVGATNNSVVNQLGVKFTSE
jgi:hypothetical protein